MKIYYIVNARIPTEKAYGYEDAKMCEVFGQSGVDIEMIVPRRVNPVEEDVFAFYSLEKKFRIRYIGMFDFFRLGKVFYRLSFYLNSIFFFWRLVFMKIDQDAMVFTRMPEIVWLFTKRGTKVIFECHEWFGKSENFALYLLRDCDFIITTNRYIKQKFVDSGLASDKMLVATNGVDLKKFYFELSKKEAIKKLNLGTGLNQLFQGKTLLLYAGSFRTMDVEKGIDEILSALQILHDRNLFFVAVGGSKEDIGYYQKISKKNGVDDQCLFVGRKNQSILALWQKAADMLLAPFPDKAHYKFFMTPLKLFEYMAAKRPIIVSDLPSIREILNKDSCLFCQPDNPDDLAAQIRTLLKDEALGYRLATQAFESVKKYDWKCRVKKIMNFIN